MLPEIHPKLKELVNQEGHGTILDGYAATEAIDTSGEKLSIKGCDISSLNEDGVLNSEHLNPDKDEKVFRNATKDDPGFWSTLIGRVVFAKKIFSAADCDSQREQGLWEKLNLPFIYAIFELFDNDGHRNAEDAAAIIKHYAERGLPIPVRYSIEGSTIKREGNVLEKTVARRVAATIKPCNKSAVSDLVALPDEKKLFQQTLKKGEGPDSFISCIEQEVYPVLAKKMLDPNAGYKFSHEHHDLGGGKLMTKINVHAPTGEHVGAATFMHQGTNLVPGSVVVDEDHQRKGIASAMYSHAEKLTGKKLMPSSNQTPEGAALWAGNSKTPQFGQVTKAEDLEKGIGGALAGMALAASPMVHMPKVSKPTAAMTQTTQPTAQKTQPQAPKWTPKGLNNDLYPIAFLESSFGKNTHHEPNSHGEYHSAIGAVGLKISSAHDIYKKAKDLQKMYPNLLTPESFTKKIKSDPHFYNSIASHYWETLKKRFKTAARTAYAWRHGWGVAAKADQNVVHSDPYVKKYLKLLSEGYHGPTHHNHGVAALAINKSEDLEKTLTLGGANAAPGTLTGGAALAKEDMGEKKRKMLMLKAQALAAYRDWPMTQPFKDFLKARLPDVDEHFIDKFAEMADDLHVNKLSKAETNHIAASKEILHQFGSGAAAMKALHEADPNMPLYTSSGPIKASDVKNVLSEWMPKEYDPHEKLTTVYHATDKDTADKFLKEGVIPQLKPTNIARMKYEAGDYATFAPGRGLSGGLYVGHSPESVNGYGRHTLKIHVPHSWLEVPPELSTLGYNNPQEALSNVDGAVISRPIPSSAIQLHSNKPEEDLNKAEGIKLPDLKLPKGSVVYHNKCIIPGEVVFISGPFEGSKLKLLDLDDQYAYVQPFKAGDQDSVQVNKLNRNVEGTHFEILQIPQIVKDKLPMFVNAEKHGDLLNGTAVQKELVHGIDIAGDPVLDNHLHGSTEARTKGAIGWFRSACGKLAYTKPAVKYPFDDMFGHPKEYLSTARREVIFHNIARDYFGLGEFVPTTAFFRHPGNGCEYSASELIPHCSHVEINASDVDSNNRLLHAGDSGVLDRLAIMDSIMGHADRHRLNYITAPQNPNILLIDNALIFNFKDSYIPAYLHDYYKLRGLDLTSQELNAGALEWLLSLDPFAFKLILGMNGVADSVAQECVARLMSMQSQVVAGKHKASDVLFAHQSYLNSFERQPLENIAEQEGWL